MTNRILFLDDAEKRHTAFHLKMLQAGHNKIYGIDYAFSAKEAIDFLTKYNYVQAFLDHDLSEEDIMIEPYAPSKVPTGMTVVDYIVTMSNPPTVVVHSHNEPAATEMTRRLRDAGIEAHQIPFSILLTRI